MGVDSACEDSLGHELTDSACKEREVKVSSGGWMEMPLLETGWRRGGRNVLSAVCDTISEVSVRHPDGEVLVMCLKCASEIQGSSQG